MTIEKSPLHVGFHWTDVTKDTGNEDHAPAAYWCFVYMAKVITLAVSSSFHHTLNLSL